MNLEAPPVRANGKMAQLEVLDVRGELGRGLLGSGGVLKVNAEVRQAVGCNSDASRTT